MRKITVLVGHGGITLIGDISEITPQLVSSGWLNRQGGYHKDNGTMDEVKSIIHMYGQPNSVQERSERNVTLRTDVHGHVLIDGEITPIKDKIKANGGIWSPRSRHWSFQGMTLGAVETLIGEMTKDGSCDTKILELTWDTPIPVSPTLFGGKHLPRAALASAPSPPLNDLTERRFNPRRFNGDIPQETLDRSVVSDKEGRIIRVSGIPVPGVTGPETAEDKCELCGAYGHSRTDCICPFCRYIGLHNPMSCPSRQAAPH